ncbi:SHOCT domain-containing protein [Rhodococcus sp. NPDC059234]|uniref:SHOCT domain-containing protein n=1 Tax=Rhodococcus sp. NPDC059234 TaxID=3346781 RepID=UPI00366ADD20
MQLMDMYWSDHNASGWMYAFMAAWLLVFLALLIVAVVVLIRSLNHSHHQNEPPSPHHSAQQILAERFAKGEIDDDEYRMRSTALRGPDT